MAFPQPNEVEFGMGTVPEGGTRCVNDMEVCTYDEAHVVAGGKHAGHVAKCKERNHGTSFMDHEEMTVCPYNALHHVKKSVLDKHFVFCDDYYQHCMLKQELPVSLQKEEEEKRERERLKFKKLVPKTKPDVTIQFVKEGVEKIWECEADYDGKEDFQFDAEGSSVHMTDADGNEVRVHTYFEYQAVQEEVTKRLLKERFEENRRNSPGFRRRNSFNFDFQKALAKLPEFLETDKMTQIGKYVKSGKYHDCKL